jgi:hypothetical protein
VNLVPVLRVAAAAATCSVNDVAAAGTVEGVAAACSVKDVTVKDAAAAGTVEVDCRGSIPALSPLSFDA